MSGQNTTGYATKSGEGEKKETFEAGPPEPREVGSADKHTPGEVSKPSVPDAGRDTKDTPTSATGN